MIFLGFLLELRFLNSTCSCLQCSQSIEKLCPVYNEKTIHRNQFISSSQGILTSAKYIMSMWCTYVYIILLQSLAANKAYDKLDMTVEDALKNREIVSDIWSVISFEKKAVTLGLDPSRVVLFMFNLFKESIWYFMLHYGLSLLQSGLGRMTCLFLDLSDCDDCDCRKKSRWLHVWEPILWVKS